MTELRLSEAVLDNLPLDVGRPIYDRRSVRPGVVHLGVGAFHRAHQAAVFETLIASGDERWGVRGASLRSPAVRDQLRPQDGLYSLVVRDGDEEAVRIIGALQDVLVAPEDPEALIEALAHPDAHLATLTVTEKGYKLDAGGRLLEDDPDLGADLAELSLPRTAPGFLVAALACRRARGLPALTAISCDNLPSNGERLQTAVLALAERHDPALRDWIAAHGAFPNTMVDRIVPATTKEDVDALARRIGVRDEALVKTEPFFQWVVEDRFAGARPDLESAGVQVTRDVAPWEEAKLRLLNGAHSAIAYLGGLSAVEFVHDFVARASGSRFVERLWDEAETTLSPPPGLDVGAYRRALMTRFANSALRHRTRQIAADGSQKLPQRLLASIAGRLTQDRAFDALALAVAGWIRWQDGHDETGQPFVVDDPLAATTQACIRAVRTPAEKVAALLSLDAVFPRPLAQDRRFAAAVTRQAERLWTLGVWAAVEAVIAEGR